MKKEYETPTMDLMKFCLQDVVLASKIEDAGGGVDPGGDSEFGDEFGGL